MTISQLKQLNEQNGGKFFSHENMKFHGDTMRNLGIRKGTLPDTVIVKRKKAGKPNVPLTEWVFCTKTGRVIHTFF